MTEGMTLILLKNLNRFWNLNRSRIPTRDLVPVWSRIPGISPVPEWKEIETEAMVTMRTVTMKITLVGAVLTAWGPRGNGTATEIPAVPGGAETPAAVKAPREAVEAPRGAVEAPRGAVEAPREAVEARREEDRK